MSQLELFGPNNIDQESSIKNSLIELGCVGNRKALHKFQRNVFYALLHNNKSKYRIIDKAIQQAKEKGLSYVLCKISQEAKDFMSFASQVAVERYRAIQFMRFQPINEYHVLFGEFEIKHHTAEIIMLHFLERLPQYTIILVFGEEAYIGRDRNIYKRDFERENLQLPKKVDEFEKYWLTFYKTQYIPERRNLRYLKRMIPKKYWHLVTELKEFGLT